MHEIITGLENLPIEVVPSSKKLADLSPKGGARLIKLERES